MKSTLNLFRALPIKTKRTKNPNKLLLEWSIKSGIVFSPEVIFNYSVEELIEITNEIGLIAENMNSTFHKSWKKIKEANMEQLVMEQLIHYFTTYGFKDMGIYSEESVYIPSEKLDIPELKEDIKLTVIKGYTKEELKEKLMKMLSSGIALKEDTIKDVLDVATFVGVDSVEFIKNKEVKVAMCDYLDLIPENPIEFLRYLVYKATGKTLLIKSPGVIAAIKENDGLNTNKLLSDYEKKYGLEKLSTIFYRFKPIFLALRSNKKSKVIINKIRRLAIENHKPMPEDYLNVITSKLKKNHLVEVDKLKRELAKVNIFRKIRLAYALKFRTKDADSIVYKVRNGKGYAKEFEFDPRFQVVAKAVLTDVLGAIVDDIRDNVKDKKIYIPDNIEYSLPATEKQFTGNFPSGTYVKVPSDMIFGIHWNNVKGNQIDLDLSLVSVDAKIGWDSAYRNEERSILFSGDITDAPKGATELFYIKKQVKNAFIMWVNYYNYNPEIEVPFKIIVAQKKLQKLDSNYMVDPNNVVSVAETKISNKQKVLGLVVTTSNECRFYFSETSIGNSISSSCDENSERTRKYLFDFYENTIGLKDILEKAGAEFVEKEDCEIDLSPENLEKDTILNLLV